MFGQETWTILSICAGLPYSFQLTCTLQIICGTSVRKCSFEHVYPAKIQINLCSTLWPVGALWIARNAQWGVWSDMNTFACYRSEEGSLLDTSKGPFFPLQMIFRLKCYWTGNNSCSECGCLCMWVCLISVLDKYCSHTKRDMRVYHMSAI